MNINQVLSSVSSPVLSLL